MRGKFVAGARQRIGVRTDGGAADDRVQAFGIAGLGQELVGHRQRAQHAFAIGLALALTLAGAATAAPAPTWLRLGVGTAAAASGRGRVRALR